jgi:hypothetical protein
MMRLVMAALFMTAGFVPLLRAQEAYDAWEPAPDSSVAPPSVHLSTPADPVTATLAAGVRYYQKHISPMSRQRCPFVTTCSHFALIELDRYGAFGIIPFIDRFLFRENADVERWYAPHPVPNSDLILYDDDYFLPH